MPVFILNPTSTLKIVSDINASICVDPTFFRKVVLFQDALYLGVLCFCVGMLVAWFFDFLQKKWEK
jgi:hypothetical protein